MNHEFKRALEKRRVIPFSDGNKLVSKEIKSSKDDLEEALDRFAGKKFKYSTITAYYSIFHAARALLYHKGYREKSHHFLLVAIDALYVETEKLPSVLARGLRNAMLLREEADYHGEFSEDGAKATIDTAKKFLKAAEKILGE